ncbi:hypothetical protein GOHSU_64_00060 [Gordonia hirsuta DSM 44140 = NBRC 16056]|uniref:Uncharacterized protein n=1 Tax=Gordonia hirsuta DSM 44140 = NBRC 16056 TaxID=1121927 RepID=L7LFX1_9ACTN|nr:hypothetical protein [Gordonia hirsuta]GAC58967.1 hypothetical protein GOHSU_64_00060 [Gordonia hirsuta DSM 44140 = NBRC 16056]
MLNALAYAFIDAVNVLLIGVLVALAMMLPAGRYRSISSLLVVGDWLGVFVLALITLLVFDGIGDFVKHVVDSPVFGTLLILTGVITAILTYRGGDSSELIDKILQPLRTPSPLTVVVGLILGMIQSATSVPFFAGLAVLSASDIPVAERYGGLFLFATVALSLPILAALALGAVRRFPHSWVGRLFAKGRQNQGAVARSAGWFVSALLIGIGILRLL